MCTKRSTFGLCGHLKKGIPCHKNKSGTKHGRVNIESLNTWSLPFVKENNKTHEHIITQDSGSVGATKSLMNTSVCMLCMALKDLLHFFNTNVCSDCSVFILLFCVTVPL